MLMLMGFPLILRDSWHEGISEHMKFPPLLHQFGDVGIFIAKFRLEFEDIENLREVEKDIVVALELGCTVWYRYKILRYGKYSCKSVTETMEFW